MPQGNIIIIIIEDDMMILMVRYYSEESVSGWTFLEDSWLFLIFSVRYEIKAESTHRVGFFGYAMPCAKKRISVASHFNSPLPRHFIQLGKTNGFKNHRQ